MSKPKQYGKMESAFRSSSRTQQKPFVVASEIERDDGIGRVYLAFDDVGHYFQLQSEYPHCHEIMYHVDENDGEDSGRLIFDFDAKDRRDVPEDFHDIIEYMIVSIFEYHYIGIDTSKFVFVWQETKYPTKFSEHLIVKNAFFADFWSQQMKLFYLLAKKYIEEHHPNILPLMDMNIARNNATFRMIGCSKIGGIPITNMNEEHSIMDSIVGIYDIGTRMEEQHIFFCDIDVQQIKDYVEGSGDHEFEKGIQKIIFVEPKANAALAEGAVEEAMAAFELWDQNQYEIRSTRNNGILLSRVRAGCCPISGNHHESENGHIWLCPDGRVLFFCFRKCSRDDGKKFICIGNYTTTESETPAWTGPVPTERHNRIPINFKAVEILKSLPVREKKPKPEVKERDRVSIVKRQISIPACLRC